MGWACASDIFKGNNMFRNRRDSAWPGEKGHKTPKSSIWELAIQQTYKKQMLSDWSWSQVLETCWLRTSKPYIILNCYRKQMIDSCWKFTISITIGSWFLRECTCVFVYAFLCDFYENYVRILLEKLNIIQIVLLLAINWKCELETNWKHLLASPTWK